MFSAHIDNVFIIIYIYACLCHVFGFFRHVLFSCAFVSVFAQTWTRRFSIFNPSFGEKNMRFQHGLLVKLLAINADGSAMDARRLARFGS